MVSDEETWKRLNSNDSYSYLRPPSLRSLSDDEAWKRVNRAPPEPISDELAMKIACGDLRLDKLVRHFNH